MAKRFGDDTAERAGRLTLNPSVHISPWGTIFFPLMGVMAGWAVIGWAKPVPVDSRNFKNYKKGIFWVSFAGPLANIILGTLSAIFYAIVATKFSQTSDYYKVSLQILHYSVFINFLLGFFNLLPLPPLDGSKMVASFLPDATARQYLALERFTPMIFLIIIALSVMGISTIGIILGPLTAIGEYLTYFFLQLFS